MKIRYLGHSCFQLTESTGTSIVCDPYGNVGFDMPSVRADAVTVSHGHYDHNNVGAVEGSPVIFDKEGQYQIGGVSVTAFKCWHDKEEGKKRGANLIFKFRMDGIEVCHLGDIGEECSDSLIKAMLPVDVLLIPVGGTYTVTAREAKEYVDRIKPQFVVPMHYKTKSLNIDIEKLDKFTNLFESSVVTEVHGSEVELFPEEIAKNGTKIFVLEREESCK